MVIGVKGVYGQASSYSFTATTGTYAYLTGTTNTSLTATNDDALSNAITLPFSFTFAGTNYTQLKASSNGWITFNTAVTGNYYDNASSNAGSAKPILFPLWDDIQNIGFAPRYVTTGTAPNRIFKIEWKSEWNYNSGAAVMSFQVWLYETTNVIEYWYRQEADAVNSASASIGIFDNSSTYITLNNSSTSPTKQTSTFTTNIATKPATGQVYRFTPSPPPDCNWQLCLADSYGDGWNGGSISVSVDGASIGSWTLNSGAGPGCVDVPIWNGSTITLDYTAGSYSYENEYYLYDSYGNLIFVSGNDGTTPIDHTESGADCSNHPVTPNEQDCLGAIPICGDSYSTTNSYSGTGNIGSEINGGTSCLASGEKNDVWYIFTVQQDGDLMFTISPNNPANDYDWAVFNLTNSNCSDIYTDPSLEVSCNWSGTAGDTGPDGSTTYSSQNASGTPFNDAIPVLQGEVYVINISNFSSTQDGYFIDFSMSSDVIVDVTPPELQSIVSAPTCGQDQLTAWFTELVDTLTVEAGDFTVTGPGGPYSITYATGTSGVDQDREYQLTLNAQLIAGGTYTLVFSGQVDDACGNSVTGNSLNFVVAGVDGSTSVNDGTVVCYDDANGTATASATGGSGTYSYVWSTGATTASINGLVAGTYTVTVSDDVGVCYDIIDAVINPANPTVSIGTWVGSVDNSWTNCENWGGGRIPLSSTDVTIPNGCAFYPILTTNTTINGTTGICNSLRIQNGGQFTVNNNKDLTIDNASLLLENGGTLTVTKNITITNSATLSQTGGNISVNGNFVDNATYTCTSGEVSFNGSLIQTISGTQIPSFYNIRVNNASDVVLSTDIIVKNNITMNVGDLNIVDYQIDLGTTGTLVNETATSRIKALDGGGIPIAGGTVKADRISPSGNIAGLGLFVTPSSALGNTTIIRGHEKLQGTGSYTGNSSILRYYQITSDKAKAVITNDLTFTYFDIELNGHTDGTLIMFQEIALYGGAAYWSPLSTVNNAGANTAIATTIDNDLTTTKITLGSNAMPLPIVLVDFKAICVNTSIDLSWKTLSETNNSYFTILKSTDGISFNELGQVNGNGNSNEEITYNFTDKNPNSGENYYKLKQTDFDGTSSVSEIISADCNISVLGESIFNVFPNPANKESDVYFEIKGFNKESEVLVVIIDVLGQELYSKIIITDINGDNVNAVDKLNRLPEGTYIIIASSKNELFKKKLIIQ